MISTVRQIVYESVAPVGGEEVSTFRWLPLSPEELPCYVVGRPTIAEGSTPALVETSVPVFVLGRTTRDDDCQVELDDLAERLIEALWKPWRAMPAGVSLRLSGLEPSVLEIAGTEVPAYTATVVADSTYCSTTSA